MSEASCVGWGPVADKRARALRQRATDAERRLWRCLRGLKHEGLHFRRQAPFGRFVVDFACHRSRLILELDGSQHAEPENVVYDKRRTAYLESCGYRVVRIWNGEVFFNMDGLVEFISAECHRVGPPPKPPAS